jgi:hypothetical protein
LPGTAQQLRPLTTYRTSAFCWYDLASLATNVPPGRAQTPPHRSVKEGLKEKSVIAITLWSGSAGARHSSYWWVPSSRTTAERRCLAPRPAPGPAAAAHRSRPPAHVEMTEESLISPAADMLPHWLWAVIARPRHWRAAFLWLPSAAALMTKRVNRRSSSLQRTGFLLEELPRDVCDRRQISGDHVFMQSVHKRQNFFGITGLVII